MKYRGRLVRRLHTPFHRDGDFCLSSSQMLGQDPLIQPKMTARSISGKTPFLLIENDCMIVTGDSLLNAFDRLEVAEYSVKTITDSAIHGNIVAVNDDEIAILNGPLTFKFREADNEGHYVCRHF
ncbi:MAG TPA: hypothetical protein VFD89_05825 [Clostridia bacterium]|nr:hypothetical protein [Clostridia bacterium]